MYHSITIGTKNTWDDWHLIPESRPVFNPPSVKTYLIDVPGGDGVLDLTSALTGRPSYSNRSGSWTFYVENGFMDWAELYSEIMVYLHGRSMKAILEDDPNYYYEGLFSVNQWKSNSNWSQIVIDYNVAPYKKSIHNNGEDWLWDTFNFETDMILDYRDLVVSGSRTVVLKNDMMKTTPIIICSVSGMSVEYEGTQYPLSKGQNVIYDIVLRQGDNVLTFYGDGEVTVENTGGRL